MISGMNIDKFLKDCIKQYPNSLVMQFANLKAQKEIMKFMIHDFLPEWKKAVTRYMDDKGLRELDEDVILQEIHAKLYLEKGFSAKESELFKNSDPEGHKRFMEKGVRQAMDHENPD
ncbi:MAG TPA: hypothetical protein ENI73_02380 [Spirochaetes bacterium]|nr:hypothetical protein [Spirochaetota bacterium]